MPDSSLAALVDDAPFAVSLFNGREQLCYANSRHRELFNLKPGWTNRVRLAQHFPRRSRAKLRLALTVYREAGRYQGVLEATRLSDDRALHVEVFLHRLEDALARRSYIAATMIDVTEREQVLAETRDVLERFELVVQASNDGLWDWNIETSELYLSPRWQMLFGFATPEVGDFGSWRRRIHPQDRAGFSAAIEAHLAGRTAVLESKHRLATKGGAYRWVVARGIAVRDVRGRPYRMAGSLTDITDRQLAEERAMARQAELAHVLRLSTIGEMATGFAHELNQPLAAIANFSNGCLRRIGAGSKAADLTPALEQITEQALVAGRIVQRIRDFVRNRASNKTTVDINDCIRQTVRFIEWEAQQQQIEISLDLFPGLPLIVADPIQIEQVLFNLLRNAMEAVADQEDKRIAIETRRSGSTIRICVADNGSGFPAESANRLFEPFFTTKEDGMGMGIPISRSIIEVHGGGLSIQPNPTGGAIAVVELPV